MSAALRRLVVCLDVDRGRVVKGVSFEGLRDVGDPVALATRYEAEGADEIVFLDVSASAENRGTMLDVVSRTADALFIPLTVGGGMRTVDDVAQALHAGADKVGKGSPADLMGSTDPEVRQFVRGERLQISAGRLVPARQPVCRPPPGRSGRHWSRRRQQRTA